MPQITHLLFDCDNTLVLSENIAFKACAYLANEILTNNAVANHPHYTGPQLQRAFVGQNFRGLLTSLQQMYNFTMPAPEFESYIKREEDIIVAALEKDAEPCVGVNEVLEELFEEKRYELAVVSSSAKRRVLASIQRAGQSKYFAEERVYSAANSMEKPSSKPDPAIYLFSCEQLGVAPGNTIAIEDSVSGTKSAIGAGCLVIGYVGPYEDEAEQLEMEERLSIAGASVIMRHWNEFHDLVKQLEGQ